MCGIFGTYSFKSEPVSDETLEKMAFSIRHRGPDAQGYYADDRAALGNTRLAILDLDERSNQPQVSEDEEIIVVQNGEIYNFIELREELAAQGATFLTTGDTEVVLQAYRHWGPYFVQRLNGMFTISIYDRRDSKMWIYRDRLGVKPLYLAGNPETGRLWFASEIKTLLKTSIEAKPDYDAIAQFLALNYIPQPATAFEGIKHMPPAHIAEITPERIRIEPYWELNDVRRDSNMTETEAREELLALLSDATRIRMRSDARFGAFLSGGLDSSSVVGMMSRFQEAPIRTFSMGFTDPRFDESKFAKIAADRFGTQHTNKIMEQDAAALWHRFIWFADQPHGDVSFIPTYQVAKMAAKEVKMVLTGDGGDELFAGYEKYAAFFKNSLAKGLKPGWETAFVRESGLLLGDEPDRLLLGPLRCAFNDLDPYRALSNQIVRATDQDPINQVLYAETTTLLPGNNLVKPDRMAMANSLEVRSPLLDYRMVEFAFRVPGEFKLRDGVTKAIFKDAVQELLGQELTYRKKQMFTVPVGEWFRERLGPFCRELLFDGRFAQRGLIDAKVLEHMVDQHMAGEKNYTRQIRAIMSLEIWFRIFIDRDPDSLSQI